MKESKYTEELLQKATDLYNKYQNLRKVALELNVPSISLKRLLTKRGLHILTYKERVSKFGLNIHRYKDQIIDLYCNQNKTPQDIQDIIGIRKLQIRKYLRNQGIEAKYFCFNQKIMENNKEKVLEVYNRRQRISDVIKEFNVKSNAVVWFFKKEGIKWRTSRNYNRSIPSLEEVEIIKKYASEDKSAKEIGVLLNRCSSAIIKTFNQYNIPHKDKAYWSNKNGAKSVNNIITKKPYTLPSGKIIHIQGYEPKFLNHIFQNNLLKEEEIENNLSQIPYIENNKKRRYYPDFYIPKLNLIVEIKSWYIAMKQTKENLLLKEQATKNMGYNYIMVLDNNFEEFDKYIKENALRTT